MRQRRAVILHEMCIEINKNINKFHFFHGINRFDLSPFENVKGVMHQGVNRTLLRNVDEIKKQMVEVWIRTFPTVLLINGECILNYCVHTNGPFRILTVNSYTARNSWVNCQPNCQKYGQNAPFVLYFTRDSM